jgi:hypothetical protein
MPNQEGYYYSEQSAYFLRPFLLAAVQFISEGDPVFLSRRGFLSRLLLQVVVEAFPAVRVLMQLDGIMEVGSI